MREIDILNQTSKEIYKIVEERSNGLCELCMGNYMVQKHHIIKGKGKRKQCETEYSVINLCWHCHHGDYGVHGKHGKKLDLLLKIRLEEVYRGMGIGEEDIRALMGGKLYAGINYKEEQCSEPAKKSYLLI